jgi:hypothetical protein
MVKTALSVDAFSAVRDRDACRDGTLIPDDVASEVKWVVTTHLKTPNRQLPNQEKPSQNTQQRSTHVQSARTLIFYSTNSNH